MFDSHLSHEAMCELNEKCLCRLQSETTYLRKLYFGSVNGLFMDSLPGLLSPFIIPFSSPDIKFSITAYCFWACGLTHSVGSILGAISWSLWLGFPKPAYCLQFREITRLVLSADSLVS